MILQILEELHCSVLFTEDEEIGCVGASKFCKSGIMPSVPINYLLEFDRRNKDDAVFYSCDNPDFEKFITDEAIGFKTASGSCSDISYVAPYLNTAAVNLSCGYYNAHTQHEYVKMSEMLNNIERAKAIINKPSEHFEYIEKVYTYTKYNSKKYNDYDYSYGYGYGGYSSKKSGYGGYYDLSKYRDAYTEYAEDEYREEIYANLDEHAITFFSNYYGTEIREVEVFSITDIADYEPNKFVISSAYGKMSIAEYEAMFKDDFNHIELLVDKACNIYRLCADPTCDVYVAVSTDGDYIIGADESTPVMYYPSDLIKYPRMTDEQFDSFVAYCEIQLDVDIENQVEMYAAPI
jgi:hypothetical protein